jgi:type II secretory pathway component PulC
MTHTSTFYNAVKTVAITGLCYGWFVPVGIVSSILEHAYPTAELTEEWTIEQPQTQIGSIQSEPMVLPSVVEPVVEQTTSIEEIVSPTSQMPSKTPVTPTVVSTPTPSDSLHQEDTGTQISKNQNSIHKPFSRVRAPILPKTAKKQGVRSRNGQRKKCSSKASDEGITQISTTEFQINKKLVRQYRNDWKAAQKLARLSWYTQNGERKGLRIRGIGCGSPVRFSGLKPGDIVLSVNNKSLTSEAELLATYGRLLVWKDIELSIVRNGRPMSLRYSIRK